MIGLAQKAGKVASGEFSTEKAVKEHKAYMVIVADDSSDNTKKNFKNMCEYYKVPVYFFSNKDDLGHAIGKEFRDSQSLMKGLRIVLRNILNKIRDNRCK